jgi:hypothetical protein
MVPREDDTFERDSRFLLKKQSLSAIRGQHTHEKEQRRKKIAPTGWYGLPFFVVVKATKSKNAI